MTPQPSAKNSVIIPSLDGIRALSIVIVFFAHARTIHHLPGGFGVTVFFFLSGFLITTLLAREYDAHGNIAFRAFYLRRVVRLTPPLLVTLVFATILCLIGLVPGDLDLGMFVSQIFFYFNYYSLYAYGDQSVAGLDILWSLSVEEHFYFIWPLMFAGVASGRMGLKHIVLLLAAILLWRAIRYHYLGSSTWEIYVSTDTRFDSLLYGCLLALMNWRGLSERIFPSGWKGAAIFVFCLVTLISMFLIRESAFRAVPRYTLQGILLTPLFYYSITYPRFWAFRWLNWAPIRQIGVYSYTIYLAHYVIIIALKNLGLDIREKLLFGVISAALCIIYAALVYKFAEQPFKALRKRLSTR